MVTASVGSVRLATWNVNSIKQRVPRLLPWLDQRQPDIVCLQETKLADEALSDLLGEQFVSRGYEYATHGEVQWNGVAILSRVGLDDVAPINRYRLSGEKAPFHPGSESDSIGSDITSC